MCSAWGNAALPALGFPIRASAGHWLFSASPWLIAAVHALRRLLVPRHPPCALTILTVILTQPDLLVPRTAYAAQAGRIGHAGFGDTRFSAAAYRWRLMWLLCSFQGPWRGDYAGRSSRISARRLRRVPRAPADAGLSKLNSMLASLRPLPVGCPK